MHLKSDCKRELPAMAVQARQELQMSGQEAQAKASVELEVKAVDQTGQLRGIEFNVDYADKCAAVLLCACCSLCACRLTKPLLGLSLRVLEQQLSLSWTVLLPLSALQAGLLQATRPC